MKYVIGFFILCLAAGCGGKGLEPQSNPQSGERVNEIVPVIESFSVNDSSSPGTVPYNKAATLKWTSRDAESCTLASSSNPALASGTSNAGLSSGLVTSGTTFTLTCQSSDGTTRSVSIAVTVPNGLWFNVTGQVCSSYCAASPRLLMNAPSPEGMYCASGENRPATSGTGINYTMGTYGGVLASADSNSVGNRCYRSGQEQDNDSSDNTVACYCR